VAVSIEDLAMDDARDGRHQFRDGPADRQVVVGCAGVASCLDVKLE
jgi:hypothetical protein